MDTAAHIEMTAVQIAKAGPAKAMGTTQARLIALIEKSSAADPVELNGNDWCRLSHKDRASELGIDEKTVRRVIGKPPGNAPFVSTTRLIEGVRVALVRVGEPSAKDHYREGAIILRTVWRNYLKKNVTPRREALNLKIEELGKIRKEGSKSEKKDALVKLRQAKTTLEMLHPDNETKNEFGCFSGLAEVWPADLQIELFKMVLADWGEFANAVKIAALIELPTTGKTYTRGLDDMFFEYPNVRLIRLFPHVAVELLQDSYQFSGKTPPAALIAVNPAIWAHLKV